MDISTNNEQAVLSMLNAVAHPVWIFERKTYRIIYSNPKAQAWLGYNKAELEALTIVDIRPEDERERLRHQVQSFVQETCDAGIWTIISKTGARHRVAFHWHRMRLSGCDAVLATIFDQTQEIETRQQQLALTRAVQAAKEATVLTEEAFRKLFEAAPGKMLVLAPETYRIVAATDEYIHAAMTDRTEIYGRPLFEVFPNNPDEPEADGGSQLLASLQKVEALGLQDTMAVQKYPIRDREGKFVDRFWMPLNKPVFDNHGKLIYIIHRVEDVTGLQVNSGSNLSASHGSSPAGLNNGSQHQELQTAFLRLQENETRLRAVQRLFKLGSWTFDPERQVHHWSRRVYEIFGISPADLSPINQDVFLSCVHPEDRTQLNITVAEFDQKNLPLLEFQYRVLRPDGRVVHITGVGERHRFDGREVVVGFVQDITDYVAREDELTAAQELIRIAGEKLRIGAWRLDADMQNLVWSEGMFRIFDAGPDFQPQLDDGLALFAPDSRERIIYLLRRCVSEGHSFDENFATKTITGKNIRIRVLGWAQKDAAGRVGAIQGAVQDLTLLHQSEERVAEADLQRRMMLESISDAFFMLDHDFCFTYLNSRAEVLLARSRASLIGTNLWEEFPAAIGSVFETSYRAVMETKDTQRFQAYFPPLEKWFDVSAYPVPDGIAVYFRDATEEVQRTEHLRLLEAAVARMNDALVITDARSTLSPAGGQIVYVNPAVEKMTGWAQADLIGKSPKIFQGPGTSGPELRKLTHAIKERKPETVELLNYTKAGRSYWVDVSVSPVFDDAGHCTHFVAVERDVSDWKHAQEELEYAASHDVVTGLYNRSKFEQILRLDLEQLTASEAHLALILIDCDNFKAVNDTLGHSVGDALLRAIADRLSTLLRSDAVFGRLGGDEFIISVPNVAAKDATGLAERLRTAFLDPFTVAGERLSVTASIGLAMAPEDAQDPSQLIRNVDMAMYRSKLTGRNQVTRFDKSLREATTRQAGLTQALHVALTQQKGFWLAYQPLVCSRSKKVTGAEALLRWQHPERGIISPAEFIPAAESAGLIRMLDRMVIDLACCQLARWSQQGIICPVSINLSALSLQVVGMGQYIIDKLIEYKVPATQFGLEITESIFLESSTSVLDNLHDLRKAGVKISIDDFGTGHSSLSYLQRLPLDVIKIDRSFIERIGQGGGNGNPLITAIIAMAKALDLTTVAEGVETQNQARWLVENGCDVLQGFFYGKPVDAACFFENYAKSGTNNIL